MSIIRVHNGARPRFIDEATGAHIPGVTTITNKGIPKPKLVDWAANATIDYAIDHWDELSAMPISERIKVLSRSRYLVTDKAKTRGKVVHKLAERLIRGEQVPIPEGLDGYVWSYVRFLDEFGVQPILTEVAVIDPTNGYVGILDLLADLINAEEPDADMDTWLLDIKLTRSGIFGEVALQLAPYRYAYAYLDDDGAEHPLPEVTRTGAVWVRPDGYSLIPVVATERQFRQFLYVKQVAEFMDEARDLVGEPIDPPRPSTFVLAEITDGRSALAIEAA